MMDSSGYIDGGRVLVEVGFADWTKPHDLIGIGVDCSTNSTLCAAGMR